MSVPSPYAERLNRIPVRERSVDVCGTTTRYWEYGPQSAAQTLVLVHGFRGDHHGLEPVIAHLEGVRLIAPDLPGFGRSERFTDRVHSVESYADWLRCFTSALGLDDAAIVIGHSFGSIVVSASVAAGLPSRAVILINPIAAPALSGPRGILTRLAVFYYWLGARLPRPLGFALLRNGAIVRIMSETMAKSRDRALRRWIHDQHDRYFSAFADRDVVLEAFRASVRHDVSEYAAAISQPVLLIASDRDDLTPIAAQHTLKARFPDARLRVIRGVGHLIHYEAPAEAAVFIADWLAGGGEAQ